MTQKQVLRRLIDTLIDEMKVFGFEPSYKDQGFIRKSQEALSIYQFLVYKRTEIKTGVSGFLIEPYIWINVYEIEKYYRQITLNKVIKTDADFITIGNSIANLLANPDGKYKYKNESLKLYVFEENQISSVADQLLRQFKKTALPYCLINSKVDVVDKLINNEPNSEKVHMQNDNYRIIKGLIAAKLNRNPNIAHLIEIYKTQIKEADMYNAVDEMNRLNEILPFIEPNT